MLLTCRETRTRVDAYGARALAPADQLAVRAHLNTCEACRVEVAKAERVTRVVRHSMTVVPPPGYMDSLPARLSARAEGAAMPAASRSFSMSSEISPSLYLRTLRRANMSVSFGFNMISS